MPTYIYHCNKCGKQVELYKSFDEIFRIPPMCEECHVELQKVYQVAYVHYKGDGWYVADKSKAPS